MSFTDKLNPVFLKEIRRLVRNRTITGALVGFLFIELIATQIVVFANTTSKNSNFGGAVTIAVTLVLNFVVTAIVPLMIFGRICTEYSPGNIDIQYSSGISESKLVDGKILSGISLILLFVCAGAPFLVLSYLIGGINISIIAIGLVACVAFACIALFCAVLIGSFHIGETLRRLLFLLTDIGIVLTSLSILVFIHSEILYFNLSVIVLFFFFLFFCLLMLRAMSVALFAPAASNHSRCLKQTFLLSWIVSLSFSFNMFGFSSIYDSIECGYIFSTLLNVFMFAIFSGGKEVISRRILNETGQTRFRRFFQFFVFSGAESGMLLVLLMQAISSLISFTTRFSPPYSTDSMKAFSIGFAYIAGYLMISRGIWRAFLTSRVKSGFIPIFTIIFLALFLFVSITFSIRSTIAFVEIPFNALGAFACTDTNATFIHTICSSFVFILGLLLMNRGFVNSISTFKRTDNVKKVK